MVNLRLGVLRSRLHRFKRNGFDRANRRWSLPAVERGARFACMKSTNARVFTDRFALVGKTRKMSGGGSAQACRTWRTAEGRPRPEFVLNRPEFAATRALIGASNFGCGSSREHPVWGLQQYGIQAVIAPSFGEIFYSNAMNNGPLAVMMSEQAASKFLDEALNSPVPLRIEIDFEILTVRSPGHQSGFSLSNRHRRMFLEGLDMIGASLIFKGDIGAFARRHWASQPWVREVAALTKERLDAR